MKKHTIYIVFLLVFSTLVAAGTNVNFPTTFGGGGNPFDQSLNTTDSPTFVNLNNTGEHYGRAFTVCFTRPRTSSSSYYNIDSNPCSATVCWNPPYSGSITWMTTNFVIVSPSGDGTTRMRLRIGGLDQPLTTTHHVSSLTVVNPTDFNTTGRGTIPFDETRQIQLYANKLSGTYQFTSDACIGGYYDT